MKYIIDISRYQVPANINYDKLAKQLELAIIRTQDGSRTIDQYYKTHHKELRKRGVPTAAYAFVRGVSASDMEQEASDFYNRTKDLKPTFWFLDVENRPMADMRTGIKAYVAKLRSLGAQKVGLYVAHNMYQQLNLDTGDFDAVWIPRYGRNDGKPHTKPDFPCDIWQYTSVGRLDGYNGDLDLDVLMSSKPLEYFIGKEGVKSMANKTSNTPSTWAKDAWAWAKRKGYMDGTRPKDPITREELAAIIYRLKGVK